MRRLSYLGLALTLVGCAAIGWVLLHWVVTTGRTPVRPTPLLGVLFLSIAVFLLFQGRRVLKLKRREYTDLTPTGAFRVAVMTHSSAYTAAVFVGLLGAQLAGGLGRWEAPVMRAHALASLYGLVGSAVLLVVAIVVERWCVIDEDNSPSGDKKSGSVNLPRRATSRTPDFMS